jgi:hypothetical protein
LGEKKNVSSPPRGEKKNAHQACQIAKFFSCRLIGSFSNIGAVGREKKGKNGFVNQ